MTILLYVTCFFIAFVGALISLAIKMKGIQEKAKQGNIEFSAKKFIQQDWLSVCISALTIILALMLIDVGLKLKPWVTDAVKPIFAFVGFFSGEIASRVFGVANKRVNAALGFKSAGYDEITGNTGAPTPAAPIVKESKRTAEDYGEKNQNL